MSKPYNPLDKVHLAESVADSLLRQWPIGANALPQFEGSGIYVLYYTGPFPVYDFIADANANQAFKQPIYVGKAVPKGARKGLLDDSGRGTALWARMREHSDSIGAAPNLSVDDFWFRFLVVDDIWIPLAESLLINRYRPVWNIVVDGFGNHDPGAGRYGQKMSSWDVLHPGRGWAVRCAPNPLSPKDIAAAVRQHADLSR